MEKKTKNTKKNMKQKYQEKRVKMIYAETVLSIIPWEVKENGEK